MKEKERSIEDRELHARRGTLCKPSVLLKTKEEMDFENFGFWRWHEREKKKGCLLAPLRNLFKKMKIISYFHYKSIPFVYIKWYTNDENNNNENRSHKACGEFGENPKLSCNRKGRYFFHFFTKKRNNEEPSRSAAYFLTSVRICEVWIG